MSAIEALYIFDEHNDLILEEVYRGRPPPATVLLPLYLAHPTPRPSLLFFPDTNPSSLVYSVIQDRLLFLAACSSDVEPLLVLEFIHRVVDALEDFLGSPLLASKLEASYDVVAQLVQEMCDGGLVSTTEPNALREVVELPTWTNKFLGSVGLPSASPSLTASSTGSFGIQRPQLNRPVTNQVSPVPWRRANVRHTSNELYVDIVETLNVTIAPSGRYLCAISAGTIAFTAKVSGVPDMLLSLTAPGGVKNIVALPAFHPCVRLAHWKESPGTLSFVPPDGRFILAGYEVDLLGDDPQTLSSLTAKQPQNVNLPLTVDVRTGLGPLGSDFEIKLNVSQRFKSMIQSTTANTSLGTGFPTRGPRAVPAFGSSTGGTSSHPTVEEVSVLVSLPSAVRNIAELKASRGEAQYSPGSDAIHWMLHTKEVTAMLTGVSLTSATLTGTVVGESEQDHDDTVAEIRDDTWEYNEEVDAGSYQASTLQPSASKSAQDRMHERDLAKVKMNQVLMPSSTSISFQVKGWLPSGIRVNGLSIDTKKSRGLGAGVTPYKGVKYLTVSRGGVEVRC
ncbi:clathrin adaptor, mu subunit [Pseudovirgaria hyperparasitica]|uniref:Clathrin adaptor, mu subunit n=1 Tax=Pseudovirgaria hyperparasitica TaxID=470096 RepID=A0A6A6W6S2_9PEZI|nr:clathrin adaptor, mu subunit [Pseudovirgaria hyperparasitica]KAF2757660.1 clathrin adaptor, mu subunit [Pseudovirgaria hyperparasitica]